MDKFNCILNTYGGLISLVSLLLTIFLAFTSNNIKKEIKKSLYNRELSENRKEYLKSISSNIQGICQNIQKDDIFDAQLMGEIMETVGKLERYNTIFPQNVNRDLQYIHRELGKNNPGINKEQVVKKLSYIKGSLDKDIIKI